MVEVLLELTVTGPDGLPILGLGAQDFVVEEGGEVVDITSVTYRSHQVFAGSEEELEAIQRSGSAAPQVVDRHFILLFHDLRKTDFETKGVLSQQLRAAQGAKRWIQRELEPNDHVAVLSYDFSLKLYQDFTIDRRRILGAIDRAVSRKPAGKIWPSRLPKTGPSLARHMPLGDAMIDATPSTYDALKVIAEAAGSVPGRKRLLLFSIGTGIAGHPEITLFGEREPTLLETLNGRDVAVYTLDTTPSYAEHALAGVLQTLADATGGRYFHHIDRFDKPLRRVSRKEVGHYLVSFQSKKPRGARGFQRVEVRTVVPEFEVGGRLGYLYGQGFATPASDPAAASEDETAEDETVAPPSAP